MWAMLMAVAQLSAQKPVVWADSVTIEPGGISEVVLNVDLNTEEKITEWQIEMQLPDGIELVPNGFEYNGHYYGDDIERISLSPDLYEQDYEWLEPDRVYLHQIKKTGVLQVFWWGYQLYGWNSPMKDTHGELARIVLHSTLDESLTFTPELLQVGMSTDKGEVVVANNEQQDPPSYNTLYLNDAEVVVGSEVTLSVKMRNTLPIEGFGFDLVFHNGIQVVTDAEGNPQVNLSQERTTSARTNTFEVTTKNNGYNNILRVVAASSNGSAITPGDGEVCTVRVRAANGLKEGKYTMILRNISLADTNANSLDREDAQAYITVLALTVGDANGDGNVTVADMTAIAHHVLGNTPEGFAEKAADANEDGQVNVADYTAVAHLLLYGSIERPASARVDNVGQAMDMSQLDNTVYIAPATAIAGREAVLSVRMKNAVEAEGFQFALTLPEGVSVVRDEEGFAEATLSTERTTAARTNTFATSILPDGTLKVMAASTNGSAITAGDGEVCTVKVKVSAGMAEGDYTLLLSDVAISDTNAKSYNVESLEATLTVSEASGISATLNDKGEMNKVYDLQGRQLSNSKWSNSQMYIKDGRKYVK